VALLIVDLAWSIAGVYGFVPPPERVPETWPFQSYLRPALGVPTLVMAIDPESPSALDRLHVLSEFLRQRPEKLKAYVLLLRPGPRRCSAWRAAEGIENVTVFAYGAEREAHRFQTTAPGDTVVYDSLGRLLYRGNISQVALP
jgi:hypothetical protein